MVKRFTKVPRKKTASMPIERAPMRALVASVKRDLRRKLRAVSKPKRRG